MYVLIFKAVVRYIEDKLKCLLNAHYFCLKGNQLVCGAPSPSSEFFG
jgi:hypothetical protein